MTKREMISLLIKLAGIYAMVQFVPGLVQTLGFLGIRCNQITGQAWYLILVTFMAGLVGPGLWIALCLAVIVKSDWFAVRLYPEDGPATQLTTLDFQDLQLLGYNFIGLMLIIRVLPYGVSIITQFSSRHYAQGPDGLLMQMTPPAVMLAIGLYLFLYPQGLANLWSLIQGKHRR